MKTVAKKEDGSWKLEDLNGRLQEERKDGPISIGADFSPLSGINTPLGFRFCVNFQIFLYIYIYKSDLELACVG